MYPISLRSSSIFTTELETIFHCLQTIVQLPDPSHRQNFLIFYDSLSSIQSISDCFTIHILTQRIHIFIFSPLLPKLSYLFLFQITLTSREMNSLIRRPVKPLVIVKSNAMIYLLYLILSNTYRTLCITSGRDYGKWKFQVQTDFVKLKPELSPGPHPIDQPVDRK